MKVLVTGGAGFIGSTVARAGLAAGHAVTVLDSFATGHRGNLPPGAELVEGDVRNADAVDAALRGVEAVFHLAACVGNVRSLENPRLDSDVNVLGTINLLERMRAAGVKRLVYSSSGAIFGEPRRLPIDESHPAEPDSPYGASKLAAEKQCLCFGRVYGWQTACLRYFNAYGVNQRFDAYGNVIPIFASRLQKGEALTIYGDGEQTRDFVNVEDIARANWLALEHGASGPFNIGCGKATTINQLVEMMLRACGSKAGVRRVAPRAGEVRHSVADITAARTALKFEPAIMLDEGLRQYMKWFSMENPGNA